MIVLVFLATVLFVFIVQWFIKQWKFYKFADNIPSPQSFGLLGHAPHFLGKNEEGRLNMLHQLCLEYNSYTKLWLGPTILWILVNEPRSIQKILLSPLCLEKPFFYKFLRLENGLISAKYDCINDVWKIHRKSLNYSFNLKILQTFIPIFIENSEKLVCDLEVNLSKKKEFDMLSFTTKSALNMICGTSFGLDIKNAVMTDDVFHALERLNKIISARSHSFLLYSEPIYKMTTYYRDEMESRKVCYTTANELIKEKRRALSSNFEETENNNIVKHIRPDYSMEEESDIPTRKIFIDHVLCNDTKFNDSEVRDHVYTIVAAGSETTALQTAHTIMLLATHPEIQERVADELKEVFYSDEIDINYDNMMKLEYLERVIKESLRLCPVVPIIGRETQATIKIDEYEIPPGITLLINFYTLHRRPDIWGPDAEEFNPDHFLPDNVEKRHPYSFLPFSGGQRNCIGYRYAMIALKIILIHLIRKYKFSTKMSYKDLRFRTDINLKLCTEHLNILKYYIESKHKKLIALKFGSFIILRKREVRKIMIIFVFLITVLIVFFVQWYIERQKFYKFSDNIPSAKNYGILGHGPHFLGKDEEGRFKLLHDLCLKYDKMIKLWLGPAILWILVNDPKLIQKVLLSPVCLEKPFFYKFLRLDSGLISANQSFFYYSESIYRMSKYYRDEMESRKVCYSAADMIIKFKRQALEDEDSCENENKVNKRIEEELYVDALTKFPELVSMKKEEVLSRMRAISVQKQDTRQEGEEDLPMRKIFIDHVLCNETKFSDNEVRDHVYTIVAAGSETTALQTAHTIILLATHPDIQERAVNELKEIFYSDEVEVNYDNISKLEYLERVIKESLRLCPVVPVIGRETQAPVKIGDYEMPAGITLLINFYTLHRRPDIWGPDAEEFNPDHFLPDNVEKRHPYSFLPFSGGSRNCIGYRYAVIALKILLIHLLRAYKFSTSMAYKDLRFRTDINLKLCTKHLVSIEPRK
ncbi:CLUMA_CG012597, isoform A [Clunio marinus]|uniref:CLUMA_CG012597, isoform A n=1 Tax=Clunio marinus TaxID=568069 RepID=A0A1J1IJY3_9DIPT|nr:CLUMA_CG012597, isoform A [Clunio marinus]